MNIYPESQLGIWLNTPIKCLEATAQKNLRDARNDSRWCMAANDCDAQTCDLTASTQRLTDRSNENEIGQLFEYPTDSLFDYVKYSMVCRLVKKLCKHYAYTVNPGNLRVMDLGCGAQPAHRYLRRKIKNLSYIGVDSEAGEYPNSVINAAHPQAIEKIRSLRPDVLLLLDVGPQLHGTVDELQATLARLSSAAADSSLVVFTLAQNNHSRLTTDQPDKVQSVLNREQWLELIGEHFLIERVSGIGYLCANPLSSRTGFFKHRPNDRQDKLLAHLMRCLGEWDSIRTIDFLVSRLLGRIGLFQTGSHSLLVSAKPRRARVVRPLPHLH